ncbi:hypothetical protein [Janthinobacterium sp. UMAB-56]|uniref:hypothetical protein n=1 Tax=Janthinobacterium sp. UMAB-56 TaxID=1365361 RepID=UPI001C58E495|nr:hypothetical protein [Janthinobacterium sp. UMAB-56]
MTHHNLPDSATSLEIRAAFALAKIYRRFLLGEHEQMWRVALVAAEGFPFNAMLVERQMTECPHLFADEPELAAAWDVGVAKQREFLIGLDEIMREAANEDAMLTAEADYYAEVERELWDDIYDDCLSQGLVD